MDKRDQENPSAETGGVKKKLSQHHTKKKIFIVLLVLALLTVLGVSFLLKDEKQKNSQLGDELKDQTATIEELDSQVDKLKTDIKIKEELAKKNQQKSSKSSYSAKIGKFTLTLADKYGIFVEHDSGHEGTSVTFLTIGTAIKPSVIASNQLSEVTIDARDNSAGNVPVSYLKEAKLSSENTKQDNVDIDGVSAEVYINSDFLEYKEIFFSKNNISYNISVPNDEEGNNTLDDLLDGFKFN